MVRNNVFIGFFVVWCHLFGHLADAKHRQVDAALTASWGQTPLLLEALEFLVRSYSCSALLCSHLLPRPAIQLPQGAYQRPCREMWTVVCTSKAACCSSRFLTMSAQQNAGHTYGVLCSDCCHLRCIPSSTCTCQHGTSQHDSKRFGTCTCSMASLTRTQARVLWRNCMEKALWILPS